MRQYAQMQRCFKQMGKAAWQANDAGGMGAMGMGGNSGLGVIINGAHSQNYSAAQLYRDTA